MLEGLRFDARTTAGRTVITTTEPRDLLSRGNVALGEGRSRDALAHYDDLLRAFPESGLAGAALYNGGLALESLGESEDALVRYRRLVASGEPRLEIDSLFRIGAIETALDRPRRALRALSDIERRADLSDRDLLELGARRGAAHLAHRDVLAAERQLRDVLAASALMPRADGHHYYISMARAVLGDVAAAPLATVDLGDEGGIEAGRRIIELALERYGAVIDGGDPYWVTASVFRAAHLHSDFFERIVAAPLPASLPASDEPRYRAELLDQSRPLLERAIDLHQQNLAFAAKAGVTTVWSHASAGELPRLEAALGSDPPPPPPP